LSVRIKANLHITHLVSYIISPLKTQNETGFTKVKFSISIARENDAILITTGSRDTNNLDIPGINLKGILSGYDFLEGVYSDGVDNYFRNPKFSLGNDIMVIGGGDTSLDCARTALRLTEGIGPACQMVSLLSFEIE
jgi:NADPH-dependent glutamate synthase beta subunit-like oxidoreductase